MESHKQLLQGDIKKSLMQMTNSISLGFICLFTFNLIDTFFISMLGSKQLAAIGFVYPFIFLMLNIFFGINTGVTTQIGKAMGNNNSDKAKIITINAIVFIILLSIVIGFLGWCSMMPTFQFLGANKELLIYINEYLSLWYLGFGFLSVTMVISAAIRGLGDTKTPSKIMLISAIINGILDPILIFGFGPIPRLEITGAILATVISWVTGLIIAISYLFTKTNLLKKINLQLDFWINNFRKNFKDDICKILTVGIPSATTNIISPLAYIIIYKIIAYDGYAAVAGFGVGMRLESLAIIFSLSLSIAIVPFVSVNHGAKQYTRINSGLKYAMKVTFFIQLMIYLFLFTFASAIANLFSVDSEIINVITLYLRIIPGAYCFIGLILVILSALNAIEYAKYSLLINFIRFFILTVPLAYLGQYLYGITGVLIGIVLAKVYSFLIAVAIYRKVSY